MDDELLTLAKELTGITDTKSLVREGLKSSIEREAARRLANLGGTMPDIQPVRRRQTEPGPSFA